MSIDLHAHTTASDGSLTPSELVRLAASLRLTAVAVTDHDTVAGLGEALAAGRQHGVDVVPGCELSVFHGTLKMHILGLWLPALPARLIETMDALMRHRHDRNYVIVDRLRALGMDITYDEVKAVAGEGSVGRPHIATVMHDKGYVRTMQQAFDEYLGAGGKAHAPKRVLSAEEAIRLLREEQATVILAHPFQLGLASESLEPLVREFMAFGLDGIEAYYSEHTAAQTQQCLELAATLDLAVSGGSDFHGRPKPDIALGSGKGGLDIPDAVLVNLKARRQRQGRPCPS